MAIEKMSFAHISGPESQLDATLLRILATGMLQPEYTSKLSEYSVGSPLPLQNPYSVLLDSVRGIGEKLQIPLEPKNTPPPDVVDRGLFLRSGQEQLDQLAEEYRSLTSERREIEEHIGSYNTVLGLLSHIEDNDFNLDELTANTYLQARFGKIETEQLKKLESHYDKPYSLHIMDEEAGFTWCVYITYRSEEGEIDALFAQYGFQKIQVPEFIKGKPSGARAFLKKALDKARSEAASSAKRLDEMVARGKNSVQELYSELLFLNNAYELRKYVVSLRGHFHMIGHLLTSNKNAFADALADLNDGGVTANIVPASNDIPHMTTPVKLKNRRFARPYEMFVDMYGTPGYNDIDPTPFVAVTYTLLFGLMFGDVGQGLFICLLGWYLHRFRKMSLGPIMMRIGIASSLFGFVYGSVFGYEHLLDPLYINVLGLHEKPVEVFRPATTNQILLTAVGIGVLLIITVMIFNICVGIKRRDKFRILLSSNGLPGLIFFVSLAAAIVGTFAGYNFVNGLYIVLLMVLPMVVVFLREPIERLVGFYSKDTIIQQSSHLIDSMRFSRLDAEILGLFSAKYFYSRFGRLPTDSYRKLSVYQDDPFIIYPLKSDRDYIWCIYSMARPDKDQVDAVFHDLFFERIFIPADVLESTEKTEAFIRRCIENVYTVAAPGESAASGVSRKRTIVNRMFPDGIGAFFIESFFEMFEVLLSFVTNTLSFLRVGGFILSHAGMMSVVLALSEMAGKGASPVVMVIGNLFVMGLEGLIVGIQVLRLEFYEMFSRFYDAGGEPFVPVTAGSLSQANK